MLSLVIIFTRNFTSFPSSIPLLYLSWEVQELIKCHATSNYVTRENGERHMIFLFNAWGCGWVTKVKVKWQCDWKCHSCLELTGFWAQPAKIHVLYWLCETCLPSQTSDCPANPSYLMDFAIFCRVHLSVIISLPVFPASLTSAVVDSISRRDKVLFFFLLFFYRLSFKELSTNAGRVLRGKICIFKARKVLRQVHI